MSASIGLSFPAQIRRAADAVRVALRTALDIALPTLCPACREPVEGRGLCPACWSKLSFISRPHCERLGIPFVYDPGPGILSMEAIADPPAYRRARAAVRFDEISRALVHALKYGDRLRFAPKRRAARSAMPAANFSPRPTRSSRCRCTGGACGRAASINPPCLPPPSRSQTGVPIAAGALKRVKPTVQQVGLSRPERAANVQGAFRVPPDGRAAVAGRRSFWSTMCSIRRHGPRLARALLRAGAANVDVLIFARVSTRCERPYNNLINVKHHHGRDRHLYHSYCPYCRDAKDLLSRKGVSFHEIDVSANRDVRKEMIERANGRSTFPQIFIGATHVGGCDDLYALEEEVGKLDPLLDAVKGSPA